MLRTSRKGGSLFYSLSLFIFWITYTWGHQNLLVLRASMGLNRALSVIEHFTCSWGHRACRTDWTECSHSPPSWRPAQRWDPAAPGRPPGAWSARPGTGSVDRAPAGTNTVNHHHSHCLYWLISTKFKHILLGPHISCLGCLSRTVS